MYKLTLTIMLLLSAASSSANLLSNGEIIAAAGCCKERSHEGVPWRKSGTNFERCKAQNDSRDGDNVFSPTGRVWWDVAC